MAERRKEGSLGEALQDLGETGRRVASDIGGRLVGGAVEIARNGMGAVGDRMDVDPQKLRAQVPDHRLEQDIRAVNDGLGEGDRRLFECGLRGLEIDYARKVDQEGLDEPGVIALADELYDRTGITLPDDPEQVADLLPPHDMALPERDEP